MKFRRALAALLTMPDTTKIVHTVVDPDSVIVVHVDEILSQSARHRILDSLLTHARPAGRLEP